MNRDIEEGTSGKLSIKMSFNDGSSSIEAEGSPAGVEIVGETDLLLAGL